MRLLIFARHELVAGHESRLSGGEEPGLLLEGDWPYEMRSSKRLSLDRLIDARHGWVDEEAQRVAAQISGLDAATAQNGQAHVSVAYVNALRLRYYLVKLVRLIAAFEAGVLPAAEEYELQAARGRDEDYVRMLLRLAELHGLPGKIRWHDSQPPAPVAHPSNSIWRRWATALHQWTDRTDRSSNESSPRVILCGNPRILDPLCHQLINDGGAVWWLYDRLAVRSWLRWQRHGVGQLICEAERGGANLLPLGMSRLENRERLTVRGVSLKPCIEAWLRQAAQEHGARQTQLFERTAAHFDSIRPTHLVIDEDATPLKRIAVAAAKRFGAHSLVVQNSAPGVRCGLVPLAADRICAWGETSRWQLERWGVAAERIVVTGSPWHDRLDATRCAVVRRIPSEMRHVVVFLVPPPRDERPELVTYHKTSQTYADMLHAVLAAAVKRPNVRLTIKLHPRAPDTTAVRRALSAHPQLDACIVRQATLERLLNKADCAVSLGSSAGVEAAIFGVPAIQVLPAGSGNMLPAATWGMLGTARAASEIESLLAKACEPAHASHVKADPHVFGHLYRPATVQISELLRRDVDRDVQPQQILNFPSTTDTSVHAAA